MRRNKKSMETNASPNLVDIKDFLPLGSIVKLEDGMKYLIHKIIVPTCYSDSRFYDYAAVPYTEAIYNSNEVTFNHVDIKEILHRGYMDEEYMENIELLAPCQNI
jgi:hypothetical protein